VRIEAVSFLLPVPAQSLTPDQRAALDLTADRLTLTPV
jgi:hypothetical protein